MNVHELILKLQQLPEEQQELPVYVQDGMDPSDPCEAQGCAHKQFEADWRPERIEIV